MSKSLRSTHECHGYPGRSKSLPWHFRHRYIQSCFRCNLCTYCYLAFAARRLTKQHENFKQFRVRLIDPCWHIHRTVLFPHFSDGYQESISAHLSCVYIYHTLAVSYVFSHCDFWLLKHFPDRWIRYHLGTTWCVQRTETRGKAQAKYCCATFLISNT